MRRFLYEQRVGIWGGGLAGVLWAIVGFWVVIPVILIVVVAEVLIDRKESREKKENDQH